MSNGIILSLSIVGISIVALLIVGIVSYNKIKPTLQNFTNLNTQIKQKVTFYNKESKHLISRIEKLDSDINVIQNDFTLKNHYLQNFTEQQNSLKNSLLYLQNHAAKYSKGIASNLKEEIKSDGPKMVEIFKRSFKKTIQKQKKRHKNK